jgi:hypothetical protein
VNVWNNSTWSLELTRRAGSVPISAGYNYLGLLGAGVGSLHFSPNYRKKGLDFGTQNIIHSTSIY